MKLTLLIFFTLLTYNANASLSTSKLDSIFPTYDEFKILTKEKIIEKFNKNDTAIAIINFYYKKIKILKRSILPICLVTIVSFLGFLVFASKEIIITNNFLNGVINLFSGICIVGILVLVGIFGFNNKYSLYIALKNFYTKGKLKKRILKEISVK